MVAPSPDLPFDPTCLLATAQLRPATGPAALGLAPVRRGVWAPAWALDSLNPRQRHDALVHATALVTGPQTVFAYAAAAALWGLPRIEPWPTRVDVVASGGRPGSTGLLTRHRPRDVPLVARAGLNVTDAPTTVVDIARTSSFATGLASADHALRPELCTRGELAQAWGRTPKGAIGRAKAQLVLALADPLSMSAGESLSRAQMFVLGVPPPKLQVGHDDDHGLIGYVDFAWGRLVGEFDGKLKYRVPHGRSAAAAGEVVWREKQREDRLRRIGLAVVRWTYAQALERRALARLLTRAGLSGGHRRDWLAGAQLSA